MSQPAAKSVIAASPALASSAPNLPPISIIASEVPDTFASSAAVRLPVAFSRGHHPLPRLSFGPGLPVGASSEDELLDIDLSATMPAAEARARLGTELPEGLELLGAVEIPRAARSIDQSVAAFRWDVDLQTLPAPPAPDLVRAAVERFRAGTPLPVGKGGKRGERLVDAQLSVTALEHVSPSRLVIEIAVGPEGTLRPSAIVAALLDLDAGAATMLAVHKVATRFHATSEPIAAAGVP